RLSVNILNHHIDLPIVIQITKGCTTAGFRQHERRTCFRSYVTKCPIVIVSQDDLGFLIFSSGCKRIDLRIYVSAYDEDIRPPIVFEVLTSDSPLQEFYRWSRESRRERNIGKVHTPTIVIQNRRLVFERGHQD